MTDIPKFAYVKVDHLETEVRPENYAKDAAKGHEILCGPMINMGSVLLPSLALE